MFVDIATRSYLSERGVFLKECAFLVRATTDEGDSQVFAAWDMDTLLDIVADADPEMLTIHAGESEDVRVLRQVLGCDYYPTLH